MGGDSEYRQLIKQLKEQGYSEKDAVHMANYQTFRENPKLAGLAGAVSGALFGAGGAAISGVRTAQYAKGIREAGEVRALVDEGLKLDPTSDGYMLAQKLESDMRVRGDAAGSTISSGELVELEQALPREAVGRIAAEAVNRISAEAQTRQAAGTAIQAEQIDARAEQTAVQAEQTPEKTEQIDVKAEQTPAQRNAQEAGVHVKYYEQIDGDNGYYDNGTIWVNLSGADKNPINVVFRHEMIHTIKETNKAAYDGLRSYVMDSADTVALDDQRAKMREQYARAGVAFDEDVFADEMVARLGERVLTDNDVALAMAKRNPSSARGVLGWIKQTLRRLYRIGARNQMNQFYRFDEVMKPEDLYSKENLSRVRTLLENALGSTATGTPSGEASMTSFALASGITDSMKSWMDSTDIQDMMASPGYFKIGTTSDALKAIGVKDCNIYWRKSKIGYILNDHAEMTRDTIAQVPEKVLEKPVLVMKSKTQENSIVLIGNLDAANGWPVMAAVNLIPQENGKLRGEFNLITGAYGRNTMGNLIKESEILFLDTKSGGTATRLMQLGVQFPSRQPSKGSTIGTISYKNGKVNIQGEYIFAKNDTNELKTADYPGHSATDARRSVPTGEVYQEDKNNTGRGSPSGITADMTDDERAAVLEKKKIRLTEYTGDMEMTEKTVERLENARIKEAKQLFRILADKCGILNTDYTNDDIQLSFQFSNTSLNESAQKQYERGYDLEAFGKMLTKLPQIAKNAAEIETHEDKYMGTVREDKMLNKMHILLGAFREGTSVYPVQLEIKEYKDSANRSNKLYMTISLQNKESTDIAEDRVVTQDSSENRNPSYAVPKLPSVDSAISVPDLVRFVNSKSGDLFRYIPDSMLSGTQLVSKRDAAAREESRLGRMREENAAAQTQDDFRRSVPTGEVYQTPKEQTKSGKLTDPTEKESYKQMQTDDSSATAEETNGTLQKVAPLLIPGTARSHVGASKDLSRNLDIAAGKSEAVRRVLRQQLEVPLYNAKKQYVADYKSMLSQLREHTVELGIRPHSEESAAVMWIGEGKRQLSPKGQQSPPGTKRWHRGAKYETVSYTLEQLKKDFPERAANGKYVWENIVECERWMRATYNEYVDRINATLEEIYPDVLGRAEADLAALEAEIAKYENLTNVEGQTADLRRLQENADTAARELEAYREDPNASSDALRELVDRIQEERYDYSRRGRLDTKAAAEQLAHIKNLEARYESMRTSEEQRLADAEANARNRYERARAKEQAGREGRLSRNQSIIREKKEQAERLRRDIESGAIYKNKRLIPRRDYFHHYMEQQQSGFFSDLIGMTQGSAQIDPELIGKSENTQPNTRFTGFMQKRMGGRYVEDAVSGMIQYIPKAEYKINIEKIIPHYRAAVRDIALATKETKNANQLVDWLIAFTNDLAGKTNRIDRFILGMFGDERGRTVLTALEKATNRLKANAVTLNFGSALVQISNLSNVLSYVKDPKAFAVGAYDASRLLLGGKEQQEIRDKSVFLSERYLEKDLAAFAVTIGEKLENFSGAMLRIGDESVATLGWFTLYRQGIRQNMTQDEAIYYADDYTRRAIGGRGIGEIPLAQKARLTKLIAPFQVEVQNTWNLLMEKGMRKPDAAGLIVYFVSNFLLNLVLDAFGKSSGLDILGALADICRIWGMQLPWDDEKEEDDKTTQEKLLASGQRLAGEIVSAVPMANEILPTVLTDETFRKSLFGENDPTRYGTGTMLARAIEQPLEDAFAGNNVDILSPALNFLMPMGGKQLERTIRSLQSYGVLPQANIKARRGGSSWRPPGVETAVG